MAKASSLPPLSTLKACPHCGSDEYFVKMQYRGSGKVNRRFDGGSPFDNSGMYDKLIAVPGKIVFCNSCFAPIARNDREHPELGA